MACPPKWTTFYFIIYLVLQNNEVNCQYSPERCGSSSGDLLSTLIKELGEKERNLLLNALLTIATNNGILPDLSPLIPSRPTTNNVAQTNSVPQTLNIGPFPANIAADFETSSFYEPPHIEFQNQYGTADLVIPTQPTLNDIIFTICPAYGVPDSPYIVSTSPSLSVTSLPSQSSSPSYSSSLSQSSSSQSSSSQSSSSSQLTSSSQSTPSSQSTSSLQSTSSSQPISLSQLSSSSHSSISQQSSSHSPATQSSVLQSDSSAKTSALSKTFVPSKQSLNTLPSSTTSSQPSAIKPKPSSTPVTSLPSLQPSHNSPPSSTKPSDKLIPSQTTKSKPIEGTEITTNAGHPTNSHPYYDEFPMNLEINLPAPNIPEPRITIMTAPAPIEKKSSTIKQMLPLILIAMLCNERNNACPCICNSPSIVPIPYPIPIPFPSCGNYKDDDDDDDDDIPKKTNRQRRKDYDFWEQTLIEARR